MADDGRTEMASLSRFDEIVGYPPFPWQRELHAAFVEGKIPDAVDVPTGLGKTLAVLLFLLARLNNPELPTRVVYVVDRRAIVDQTAEDDSFMDRPNCRKTRFGARL